MFERSIRQGPFDTRYTDKILLDQDGGNDRLCRIGRALFHCALAFLSDFNFVIRSDTPLRMLSSIGFCVSCRLIFCAM
jgi:hypothetical protein